MSIITKGANGRLIHGWTKEQADQEIEKGVLSQSDVIFWIVPIKSMLSKNFGEAQEVPQKEVKINSWMLQLYLTLWANKEVTFLRKV